MDGTRNDVLLKTASDVGTELRKRRSDMAELNNEREGSKSLRLSEEGRGFLVPRPPGQNIEQIR